MLGWFDVGRLACCLFMVGLLSVQQFGWCMVVLAALPSACSPFGLLRCGQRWHRWMLSLLSLRFFAASLLGVVVTVLRPGRAWRLVLARCHRSRN